MAAANWTALLWLLLVPALIPAALWLLKRSGMAGRLAGGERLGLRQVGVLPLGPQQRLVAVEVGSGAGRHWLLLGVSAQQVQTLEVLREWPGGPAADTALPAAGFGAELARRLHAQARGESAANAPGNAPARGDHG